MQMQKKFRCVEICSADSWNPSHTITHTHTRVTTHTFLAPLWHRVVKVHVNSIQGLSGKIWKPRELKWIRWWRETLCRMMWAVRKSQTNMSGIQILTGCQLLLLFVFGESKGWKGLMSSQTLTVFQKQRSSTMLTLFIPAVDATLASLS